MDALRNDVKIIKNKLKETIELNGIQIHGVQSYKLTCDSDDELAVATLNLSIAVFGKVEVKYE